MNEVLIIKQGPGQAMFYYTRDALRDVQLQLVRDGAEPLPGQQQLGFLSQSCMLLLCCAVACHFVIHADLAHCLQPRC